MADHHGYQFAPVVYSHNGQIHIDSANFARAQIDHKLRLVDGRRDSIWKLWVRHISVAINRTVSRNIQRKITKMNASNSANRKASSSGDCEKNFLSSSSSAEELEQNTDVLLLGQGVRQSQYADSQRFIDVRSEVQLYSQQGSDA